MEPLKRREGEGLAAWITRVTVTKAKQYGNPIPSHVARSAMKHGIPIPPGMKIYDPNLNNA